MKMNHCFDAHEEFGFGQRGLAPTSGGEIEMDEIALSSLRIREPNLRAIERQSTVLKFL